MTAIEVISTAIVSAGGASAVVIKIGMEILITWQKAAFEQAKLESETREKIAVERIRGEVDAAVDLARIQNARHIERRFKVLEDLYISLVDAEEKSNVAVASGDVVKLADATTACIACAQAAPRASIWLEPKSYAAVEELVGYLAMHNVGNMFLMLLADAPGEFKKTVANRFTPEQLATFKNRGPEFLQDMTGKMKAAREQVEIEFRAMLGIKRPAT